MSFDHLYQWLLEIDSVLPPFVVEIVLRDNSHFFLHSVPKRLDKGADNIALRVYDFRAIAESDIEQIKSTLNNIRAKLNSNVRREYTQDSIGLYCVSTRRMYSTVLSGIIDSGLKIPSQRSVSEMNEMFQSAWPHCRL